MSLGGRGVFNILLIRIWRGTVSKALLMSMAARMVRVGGSFWLKPVKIRCVRSVRSVVVECCCLKPCCVFDRGMSFVILVLMSFSKTLDIVESNDIGR